MSRVVGLGKYEPVPAPNSESWYRNGVTPTAQILGLVRDALEHGVAKCR